MDDLLSEFLTETSESLDVVDVQLVELERDPNNQGIIDNIFRLVHTIKGTCGFLGLPRLEGVAHASENVLGKFREGAMDVTPDAVSLILESLDRIKMILGELEATEQEPAGDDSELIGQLNTMAEGGHAAIADKEAALEPEERPDTAAIDEALNLEHRIIDPAARAPRPGEVSLDELERAFQEAPGPEDPGGPSEEEILATSKVNEQPTPAKAPPSKPDAAKPEGKARAETSVANQSIRVNVEVLENLMTMVSELVLTRNQLLQMVRRLGDTEFKVPLQRLSHVTTELQEGVMMTRMQPIGNAWQKLPRIVRDLALELNKKIDLVMLGADTELDRQVLELIKDPLTHMVRNSADHGLEMPAERIEAGKPETGTVTLNAFHEGGHINIEIKDDGKGLNLARIKNKMIENGVATESQIDEMTEQQIQRFIFNAGLSTAEKVTSVSGRGVGMDVVKTNIEKIGGTIDLKSTEGKGTTFTIKIPLTLAIVSALIVESGGERFAIPQLSVVELVRASGESEHRIERINRTPVLRLRNRLLPLVRLSKVLGLDQRSGPDDAPEMIDEDGFVVVTQVGNFSFGIVVDRVFDTEEIVVKPVAPILRDISVFSGNTILGDGSVIMILDPNGIAESTADNFDDADRGEEKETVSEGGEETMSLLLFKAGGSEPKAVPLSLVARLEEIAVEEIEISNGHPVVQYRGALMPIIMVNSGSQLSSEGRQAILVFADEDKNMGLAVDDIIDIVEDKLDVELASNSDGMLGSAVIKGEATEVLDVGYYLNMAFSDWFGIQDKRAGPTKRRVLLVDDSSFFRNMLTPLLKVHGYDVTTVDNGQEALDLREAGKMFDVIVSDIEMPEVDGFELARQARSEPRWENTPIIALSSHSAPEDFERGRDAGFTDYVVKLDRDALLGALEETLEHKGELQ